MAAVGGVNGATLLAGYLLVGLGISLTTAPRGASRFARVAMVPGWAPFFVVAAVILAIRRGQDL